MKLSSPFNARLGKCNQSSLGKARADDVVGYHGVAVECIWSPGHVNLKRGGITSSDSQNGKACSETVLAQETMVGWPGTSTVESVLSPVSRFSVQPSPPH